MESLDRGLPPDDDPRAREEADAAAAEAGSIGGRVSEEDDLDPADRPLAEAGGGYAEGFEQAEDELIERASHGDATGDPIGDAGLPEGDVHPSRPAYGEADEIETSEVVRDPETDPDDPREGPGITHER